MRCRDFLTHYSDFRDGVVLDTRLRTAMRQHLRECQPCAKHDELFRAGVHALRAESVSPGSPDLTTRIEAAIRGMKRRDEPLMPLWAGWATAAMIAVGVGLLIAAALSGSQPVDTADGTLEPVPYPQVVANPGLPFVTFQDPRAGVSLGVTNNYVAAQRTSGVPVNFR
jgi:hypothetical protein